MRGVHCYALVDVIIIFGSTTLTDVQRTHTTLRTHANGLAFPRTLPSSSPRCVDGHAPVDAIVWRCAACCVAWWFHMRLDFTWGEIPRTEILLKK